MHETSGAVLHIDINDIIGSYHNQFALNSPAWPAPAGAICKLFTLPDAVQSMLYTAQLL